MSYDWWVGRRGHQFDGTRFNLREIFLSTLTNFLYGVPPTPPGGPSWWGLRKKQAIARWASRIELLAMVEDTHDGTFSRQRRPAAGVRTGPGPVQLGLFDCDEWEQSVAIRQAANKVMAQIAGYRGLGPDPARRQPVADDLGPVRAVRGAAGRGPGLGLPAAPAGFEPRLPPEHVGDRVLPRATVTWPRHRNRNSTRTESRRKSTRAT